MEATVPELEGPISVDEYLAREEAAELKSEYVDGYLYPLGEIMAMAGAAITHNDIVANVAGALIPRTRGTGCRVAISDQRVRVREDGRYAYPDVSVVCGERTVDPKAPRTTITNPSAVFEVLSPSTEAYDRGSKFLDYQQLDSIEEIFFVSQTTRLVERYRRAGGGDWTYHAWSDPEAEIPVDSVGINIGLGEIYVDIEDLDSDSEA